jgi:hypothetical protein
LGKLKSKTNKTMAKTTFSVKLEFTDISANTPQEAVNTILKWIKEGVDDMIFDVQDETTKVKYTVDLSEEEENQVLSNND